MEQADGVGGYQHINNPEYLRTAVHELNALIAELDDWYTAESLDADLAFVAGVHGVKVAVLRRLQGARRRLDWLRAADSVTSAARLGRRPQLVNASTKRRLTAPHGLEVASLVTAGDVPCGGISSGMVWLPAGLAAQPHLHADTDVIVLVSTGEAMTLWWDGHARMYAIHHGPGEHLFIPRGVPHCGYNPFAQAVVAHEFWSDARFGADVQLRPDLLPDVRRHRHGSAGLAEPSVLTYADSSGSRAC